MRWGFSTGNKLQKQITDQLGNTTYKNYVNGIEYIDNNIEAIYHSEGRIIRNLIGITPGGKPIYDYRYEYNIKDHLGNTRVCFSDLNDNGIVEVAQNANYNELLQQNHYYPFGMNMTGHWNFAQPQIGGVNGYQFNGIELNEDFELNWNMAFYRSYDAAIGRWNGVDPKAEMYLGLSPYNGLGNNPIVQTDKLGANTESTHTDKYGNVLAIYDDGDLGVYKHTDAKTKTDVDKLRTNSSTNSGGGEKMGETLTPFGFADFARYEETRELIPMENAKIDFDCDWAHCEVTNIMNVNPNMYEVFTKAGTGGVWDLKHPNNGQYPGYGSKLFGKYASARDAGNFAAGVAAQRSFDPDFVQYGFSRYNEVKNSKFWLLVSVYDDFMGLGFGSSRHVDNVINTIKHGEDILTQMGIDKGKEHVLKNE